MNRFLKILEILCGIILTALGLLLSYFLIQRDWSDSYINFFCRGGRWYTTLIALFETIVIPIIFGLFLPWVITKMIFHREEFMSDTTEDKLDNVSDDSFEINSNKDSQS